MSQRVKKNMIYVPHDQIEVMILADRIVFMHGRDIQQQGIPEEQFKKPVNTFVAGFMGRPPISFPAHRHYNAAMKILPEFNKATGIEVEVDQLSYL